MKAMPMGIWGSLFTIWVRFIKPSGSITNSSITAIGNRVGEANVLGNLGVAYDQLG